jgi:hypothetical protein
MFTVGGDFSEDVLWKIESEQTKKQTLQVESAYNLIIKIKLYER